MTTDVTETREAPFRRPEPGSEQPEKRGGVLRIVLQYVLLFAVLGFGIRMSLPWIVFRPTRELSYNPKTYGMPFEDVTLTTADGVKISGWYVPAPSPRGTLLFFHGNAGNISHRLDSIEIFRELGLSVFIIDYRGYGKSEGRPSISGTAQDVLAAWKYLTDPGPAGRGAVHQGRVRG
jgi:pimeloyl-ACP methyl ester carboxylesterase